MVEYIFPSKRQGWVNGVRGTVVESKKWSETHISSSGGGGYIHPQYGGQVAAPQVHSTVIKKSEIWIKNSSGKDVLVLAKFPAAKGQDVLVLWGNIADTENGPYLYWRNFTSDQNGLFPAIANKNNRRLLESDSEENIRVSTFIFMIIGAIIIALGIIVYYSGFGPGEFFGPFYLADLWELF